MQSINIEYNINGIGVVTPVIYPFVNSLYSNSKLQIEPRLKDINQLGAIKYIHNGAHYTRYEYVLLQFMLINFMKNNSEWGLGSKFNFSFLENPVLSYENKITGAEILELIVLFGNIGHFRETFSSNKVWFHYLFTNKHDLRNSLKKGLKSNGKTLLDEMLTSANSYKIQWINTLFILSRSEKLNDYRLICERVFDKILSNKSDKWLDLYYKIRKVSYVVLDSHYSHIPISISLQNVLFNENLFVDELSKYSSGLMGAFDRVNDLLEDTLYLENNTLLMGTYRSIDIYTKVQKFLENNQNTRAISKVNMLINDENTSPFYKDFKISDGEIPWDKEKNLSITFFVKHRDHFPRDVFQKEIDIGRKLGRECYIAFNFSPSFSKYRTVYSMNKGLDHNKKIIVCLKIIRVALEDYMLYRKYSYDDVSNGRLEEVAIKKIITYFFRNLLTDDYFCEFEYPKNTSPFIVENGCKKTIKKVDDYIDYYELHHPNDKDAIHELKAVRASLESITYKGLIIVYLGSLRFINNDKKSVCELDGLIFTPKHKDENIRVIEAKNLRKKQKRYAVAAKQLEKQFIPLLPNFLTDKIVTEEIEGFGAQTKIGK
ncbi:hypothetical protein SAMN05192559_11710 [Halobacillus karajensis]|uniref:hypothetical protein n=1 Tax=Halobacillus karajensis TaxID=195088 RepID=UPI0008A7C7FF|nr:hypothetical protein [Halobacillus karajensis]SEI13312.1 hypothetical protein SAMN05192559_11710 [Halobacillus karajensis]